MWKKLVKYLIFFIYAQSVLCYNASEKQSGNIIEEFFDGDFVLKRFNDEQSCSFTPEFFRPHPAATENNRPKSFAILSVNNSNFDGNKSNFSESKSNFNETTFAANKYPNSFDVFHVFHKFSHPYIINSTAISAECRASVDNLKRGLNNLEMWALKMVDATAKLPSGILSGNVNQYGDFDECLSVDEAQYCLPEIELKWREEMQEFKPLVHSYFQFRGEFNDVSIFTFIII